ncbi:MAG: hypothetical protein H6812_12575 [Phycisphaeraceae bacterium]|nr:hypothetical protein [Phycisphaerales bacterium]MCA9305252.1 hypothetical protein [Phycisphaerales bacterium]MCB9844071.1 hypothetical protein [Phycisphaeraceae bacterium]
MARNGRKRVWRGVRRSVVYIFLGLISNLLIAWSCAIVTINPRFEFVEWSERVKSASQLRKYARLDGIGVCSYSVGTIMINGPQPIDDAYVPTLEEYGVPRWVQRWLQAKPFPEKSLPMSIEAGFPMRSFGGIHYWSNERRRGWRRHGVLWLNTPEWMWWYHMNAASIDLDSAFYGTRFSLPYRPRFPGLIVNTLFYAALWFGLTTGWRAMKHRWRMHRGRCPKCKYDLARDFSTGCPECGWRRETTPRPVSSSVPS